MVKFEELFEDEYQFRLKSAEYRSVEATPRSDDFRLKIIDNINTQREDALLKVEFCRAVCFEPEVLFSVDVVFEIILTFKSPKEDYDKIDWKKELVETETKCFSNVISRSSNLIASITSSCGMQPVITPPVFISEDE